MRAWKEREGAIREDRAAAQRRLDDVNAKIDRLTRRALLDDGAFDAAAVRRLREELERERVVAEVAAGDLACDALDVEAVLAFAEHVLTGAGRVWTEATPAQRLRLGDVLFPDGVTFDAGDLRTAFSAFELSELRGPEGGENRVASPTGMGPLSVNDVRGVVRLAA